MHARTLTIFRLYQLFNGIIFTGPVWAVYLLSRGLTLTQFGLVEAALHVGMLVAQVPTGALADALGRRRLLVAAGFFTAVGELGYVYAPGFGLICLAGAIHGVAFALRTGADEAYLFDALAHDDAQAQFPRMLGGLWAVFQFASAISFLAGGLIATWSRPAAFWLTAICALIASGIASRLPDDARGSARQGLSVARSGLAALRRSPRLAVLTIAWSIYWAAFTSAWFYAAPLFAERGASDAMLGFALGGGMLVGARVQLAGRPHARPHVAHRHRRRDVAGGGGGAGAGPGAARPGAAGADAAGGGGPAGAGLRHALDLPPAQHPFRVPGDVDVDRRGLLLDPDAVAVPAGRLPDHPQRLRHRLRGLRRDVAAGGGACSSARSGWPGLDQAAEPTAATA